MMYSLPSTFRAKKSFGQNFLINDEIIERIVAAGQLQPGEHVIEVGPGKGILTKALLAVGCHVTAIEKDRDLFAFLQQTIGGEQNLTLVHADALTTTHHENMGRYKLIANIPYSITSPLLDHFIRKSPTHLPTKAVLLIQKEVAQKLCAPAGDMNVLALHVQPFGTPKKIFDVGPDNFRPRPKVDSSVITIDFLNPPPQLPKNFFEVIHKGFSHKRKMLRGIFDIALLEKAGIDPTSRAETLTKSQWAQLAVEQN